MVMDVRIKLGLNHEASELSEVAVTYPVRSEAHASYRGGGLAGGAGSFTWSGAVQALSVMLLRAAAGKPAPQLSGGRESPASALDYAISKDPRWLVEMFGADSHGHALIRRFVSRSNPNLKRPGPVSLSVSAEVSVCVVSANLPITDRVRLEALADRIERNWSPYGKKRIAKQQVENRTSFEPIERMFEQEIDRALDDQGIFDRALAGQRLRELADHPLFARISGRNRNLLAKIDYNLPPAIRLGLADESFLRRELCRAQPIRIACAVNIAGANAIFHHLRDVKGYNIEVDSYFAHALEIGLRIASRDPAMSHDLAVVANAPAATLLAQSARHDYEPQMLLPTASQRIVAPKGAKAGAGGLLPGDGSYSYLLDSPSTSMFYFNRLLRSGTIRKNRIESVNREPDESARDLRSGDPDLRSILFFPYYKLNEIYNGCLVLDRPGLPEQNSDMLLFARKEFSADTGRMLAIKTAIRNAWFELSGAAAGRKAAAKAITGRAEFRRILNRFSGIAVP